MNAPNKTEQKLSCEKCRFHVEIRNPQLVGVVIMECKRNPPIFIIMPTPDGRTAAVFGHPQVGPQQFCFSYESISPDLKQVTMLSAPSRDTEDKE